MNVIDEADAPIGSANPAARTACRRRAIGVDVWVECPLDEEQDEAICELLARPSRRLRWSQSVKSEEFDGVPVFAPLPSL